MINESVERPPAEVVQGFRNLLSHDSITCAISDCMGRFNAMTSDMRPLFEGIRLVGTAVTVKTLAADLAAAFKAIDVSQPGDIVVIDSHGSVDTAFWGENMTMSALNRGVIGAVIDGACRDIEEIRRMRSPVICKGVVPNVGAIAGYGGRERYNPMRGGGVTRRRRGCGRQRSGCRSHGTGCCGSGVGKQPTGDGASSSREDQGGSNYRRVGQC
jgi:Demethylmenaquinone methyltransferase